MELFRFAQLAPSESKLRQTISEAMANKQTNKQNISPIAFKRYQFHRKPALGRRDMKILS